MLYEIWRHREYLIILVCNSVSEFCNYINLRIKGFFFIHVSNWYFKEEVLEEILDYIAIKIGCSKYTINHLFQ